MNIENPKGPSDRPVNNETMAVLRRVFRQMNERMQAAEIEALEDHNPIRLSGPLSE